MTREIYHNAFGRLGLLLEDLGAVYVCPEYRGNSWMGPAAEQDVAQILQIVNTRYHPARTLFIGASMGGTSALIYAMRHPEEVHGVLALCPASDPAEVFNRDDRFRADMIRSYGGSPLEKPEEYLQRTSRNAADRLVGLPIVLVHGTADGSIPVDHSIRLAEALRASGTQRFPRMPRFYLVGMARKPRKSPNVGGRRVTERLNSAGSRWGKVKRWMWNWFAEPELVLAMRERS